MTREEHISNLETIGCDGWTVTTEAYKSLQFAIKALKQEPCEDCISRADVRRILNHEVKILNVNTWKALYDKIDALPSVQPIRPKGQWILCYGCYECTVCHCREGEVYNFCPNCGEDMRGEKDGTDKQNNI